MIRPKTKNCRQDSVLRMVKGDLTQFRDINPSSTTVNGNINKDKKQDARSRISFFTCCA